MFVESNTLIPERSRNDGASEFLFVNIMKCDFYDKTFVIRFDKKIMSLKWKSLKEITKWLKKYSSHK